MHRPSHSSRFDHLNDTWWGAQTIKLLAMQSSPLPCHLVPLRSKYLPQHPEPMFLPRCERPSFAPMQNNRQSYSNSGHEVLTVHLLKLLFPVSCSLTWSAYLTHIMCVRACACIYACLCACVVRLCMNVFVTGLLLGDLV
jgi:hypothetical protein